jgi:hypothetical protein
MDMDLREYFENVKGHGVLATADAEGKVDAAIYGKPHFMDDGSIAFIMADRLTHANLQSNNHAAYLFKEKGKGYKGIRLARCEKNRIAIFSTPYEAKGMHRKRKRGRRAFWSFLMWTKCYP